MAYVCTHIQDDASYTPYVDAMFATLSGAGWELHDEVSSTNRVYRSKGENGNYCYGYMQASFESPYYLELKMYQDWNSSTHVGIAGTYYGSADARIYINLYKPVLMYCNKNFLYMWSTQSAPADNYTTFAGMLSEVFDTTLTTTISGISAGSDVTVPVLSSAGFIKGARYKMVGINQEGREVVTIYAIPNSSSLVVSSLSYTYASGTYLGKEPCPIYSQYMYSGDKNYGFGYNSTYSTVDGTGKQTNSSTRLLQEPILTVSLLDTDPTYSLYGLAPIQFHEYNAYSYIGYIDDIFYAPTSAGSVTAYDGVYMNSDLYTLRASPIYTVVSATTNTVTLNSVSFDTDEHQNKIIIIAIGNSAGHTRKIVSNTSDTITVETNFYFTVNADESVIICDEVYRPFGYNCFKEII